jgi:hypothetical protein
MVGGHWRLRLLYHLRQKLAFTILPSPASGTNDIMRDPAKNSSKHQTGSWFLEGRFALVKCSRCQQLSLLLNSFGIVEEIRSASALCMWQTWCRSGETHSR